MINPIVLWSTTHRPPLPFYIYTDDQPRPTWDRHSHRPVSISDTPNNRLRTNYDLANRDVECVYNSCISKDRSCILFAWSMVARLPRDYVCIRWWFLHPRITIIIQKIIIPSENKLFEYLVIALVSGDYSWIRGLLPYPAMTFASNEDSCILRV